MTVGKTTGFTSEFLKLIFLNTTIPNLGDATGVVGSTTPGSLYLSLHTASPGASGNQSTNEATYSGYARVAVARDATVGVGLEADGVGVWTFESPLSFPVCASGSNTITHVGIGTAASGAGNLMYFGDLTSSISVTAGIQPFFLDADYIIRDE